MMMIYDHRFTALQHQDSVLCIPWNTYKNTIWICYKNAKTAFARKGTKLFLPFEGPIKSGSAYPMAFKQCVVACLENKMLCFLLVFVKWFSLKNVRSKLQVHHFQLFYWTPFYCGLTIKKMQHYLIRIKAKDLVYIRHLEHI